MNKCITTATILAIVVTGFVSPALAQTVPTIVSLSAAPTRAQVQQLAVNALVTAAQSGGVLSQVQDTAAQILAAQLNTPNILNPSGGSVTLAQARAIATSNPAAAQAALAQVSPQANIILSQNAAAALQSSLVQAAASQAATIAATQPANTPAPVPASVPQTGNATPPILQPSAPASTSIPTIVSLPSAPTLAVVRNLAVKALLNAAQAGGTLAQVQNAAAQQLLINLNAPDILNPNGGTATLAQALLIVTSNPVAATAAAAPGIVISANLLLNQNALAALQQQILLPAAVASPAPAAIPPAAPATPTIQPLIATAKAKKQQQLAVNALVAAAKAGGTFAKIQAMAAKILASNLNAAKIPNHNKGYVTQAEALAMVTQSAVSNQAALAKVPLKVKLLLTQNAIAALEQIVDSKTADREETVNSTQAATPTLAIPSDNNSQNAKFVSENNNGSVDSSKPENQQSSSNSTLSIQPATSATAVTTPTAQAAQSSQEDNIISGGNSGSNNNVIGTNRNGGSAGNSGGGKGN